MSAVRTTVIGSYPLSYGELGPEAVRRAVKEQISAGVRLVSDGQTRGDMISIYAGMIKGLEARVEGAWGLGTGRPGAEGGGEPMEGEGGDRSGGGIRGGRKSRTGEGGGGAPWSGGGGGGERKVFITGRVSAGDASKLVEDFKLARETAGGRADVKAILTGPVTLAFSSILDTRVYGGYRDRRLYLDLSAALLEIARGLEAAGARHFQLDEPFFSIGVPLELAHEAVEALATGIRGEVALHVCGDIGRVLDWMLSLRGVGVLSLEFAGAPQNLEIISRRKLEGAGKLLGLGCIDTASERVESEDEVLSLLRRGVEAAGSDNVIVHPDCGLRGLPLDVARAKLRVMCAAARRL
ncbi:MAG: hypothetical protein ACUVV6_05170 [Thermoplasmatota archaeon]